MFDVLRKIIVDLAWRGPNDRKLGHIVLPREMAEKIVKYFPEESISRSPFSIDRRHARATVITASIMKILGNDIRGPDYRPRDIAEKLYTMFSENGIDWITDADRREAGLPQRGSLGWTKQELHALELHRLNALLAPHPMIFPQKIISDKKEADDPDTSRDKS